jgi:hypothetical protein
MTMTNKEIKRGNDSKDSMYLSRIKAAILLKPGHPRHHGVQMQAHHVISAEGMKISRLGAKISKFGYDINSLENLVFIPCTLQGACYLGVQPHRGNHTARIADQDNYDDDCEPPNYHEMVAENIQGLDLPLSKECSKDTREKAEIVREQLNGLSKQIAGLIQHKPTQAPLTEIARHFSKGNKIGCGGVDSVTHHSGKHCDVERNHLGRQGPGQRNEDITYVRRKQYTLKVGE